MEKKVRIIAIYLPQFHPIPENDAWWGKGFTEWTNVARAKPLFKGHYQPRIPSDLGFYDLRLAEVREEQAKMAKEAGIEGFCYYHYWFGNGKQLLERPFNEVVDSGKPDFPFCLCWANHTWTNKTWEKTKSHSKSELLIEQKYLGEEDDISHFYSLLKAFRDPRYIRIENKPIFVIYHPHDFIGIEDFITCWNKLAIQNGFEGIYFIGMSPATTSHIKDDSGNIKIVTPNVKSSANIYNSVLKYGFNAVNSFGKRRGELLYLGKWNAILQHFLLKFGIRRVLKFDYAKTVAGYFSPEDKWENVFPTILPQYDRTPRNGRNEGIYTDSTPSKFKKHVIDAINVVRHKNAEHRIIFLDAWNEWAEGCYVEPDLKFGHGYLNAIKEAIEETRI